MGIQSIRVLPAMVLRLRVQSPAWEEIGWRRRKDEIPAEKMGMGNPRQEEVVQVLC